MQVSDFNFELPPELIAQYPCSKRSSSKLLCLNRTSGEIKHSHFYHLPELLTANDLLVMNNTKVIPARIFGKKPSGGRVEVLVECVLNEHEVLAHVRASKSPKPGITIEFDAGFVCEVVARKDELFHLKFHGDDSVLAVLSKIGHMPLPPYIEREDESLDRERYQSVFAARDGAIAAPTASLHFDHELLENIKQKGVDSAFITLHVGAGTFQPVRVDDILQHKMHAEYIEIGKEACDKINATHARGGRVIAVGTTVVRSLETAALSGSLKPFNGDTDIFIYPGFKFNCVDALITNFHLPKSTLLMLVSALASREFIMQSYQEAIAQHYRFFSYGDAMFIL